jgi:hypothetical protein
MSDPRVHAVLGSLVVTVGFWLIWKELPVVVVALVGVGLAGLLTYLGPTVGAVWAWATLLLGVECLAWPFVTMVQVRMVTTEPTDQQMGEILTAVLWGLPSGVFWTTMAWGLFKRLAKPAGEK